MLKTFFAALTLAVASAAVPAAAQGVPAADAGVQAQDQARNEGQTPEDRTPRDRTPEDQARNEDQARALAEGMADDTARRGAMDYQKVDFNPQDDPENILLLDLSTGRRVAIRLMPDWAPHHVERIKTLARSGFYDGVIFHRVIDGFMAQTGDPTGTGQGGSDLPDLQQEFNPMPHLRGTVSMARAQSEDSANSQFFIVFYPRFALDKQYTNFGRVIAGMDAVDQIARGEPPRDPTRIVQASIAADDKPAPTPEQIRQALSAGAAGQDAGQIGTGVTADMLNAPIGE